MRVLLFDLDNTLYSRRTGLEDHVRCRMMRFTSALLGVSAEEAWRERMEFRREYGTNLEWLMGEKGFTDVEAYFAAIHPADEADALPPDPGLRAFLAGIPLPKAILTNSPAEHADRVLVRLGIADLFTHVFDIRLNGFRGKPRAEAYNRALDTLAARPADALFIDDTPPCVEGFIALGGSALLIDEDNVHGDYPHPKIRELRELAAYV